MDKLTFETLADWMNAGAAIDLAALGFEVEEITVSAA